MKMGNTSVMDFHQILCVKLGQFEKPPLPMASPVKKRGVVEEEKRLQEEDTKLEPQTLETAKINSKPRGSLNVNAMKANEI